MLTPFPYQGSKVKEISKLTPFLGDRKIVDLFFGSGTVTGLLGSSGGWVNELNPEIYHIWKYVLEDNQKFFELIRKYCAEDNKFPEYYYKKRAEYNKDFWKTDNFSEERTALFYYIISSCHAALLRYGPNGFNTSYKLFLSNGRGYRIEERIKTLKFYASKIKKLTNSDALTLLKENNFSDFDVIYCDPPYVNSGVVYCSDWNFDSLLELDSLLHEKAKDGIPSVMSNFVDDKFVDMTKADRIIRFESSRMAGTKVVKKQDAIFIYGDIKEYKEHDLDLL